MGFGGVAIYFNLLLLLFVHIISFNQKTIGLLFVLLHDFMSIILLVFLHLLVKHKTDYSFAHLEISVFVYGFLCLDSRLMTPLRFLLLQNLHVLSPYGLMTWFEKRFLFLCDISKCMIQILPSENSFQN